MNLAIDFGTSYTKIGYMLNNNFINLTGHSGIPTIFAYVPSYDKLVFGYNALQLNNPDTLVFTNFKLELKRNLSFKIGSYSLLDILVSFFKFLDENYIKPNKISPSCVNLSIPNYFGINARRLLVQALNQVYPEAIINLIPEPVAALIGYTMVDHHPDLEGDLLVIDIGGGTTDFSFLSFSSDFKEIIVESQLQMGQDAYSGSQLDKAIIKYVIAPIIKQDINVDLFALLFKNRYLYEKILRIAETVKIEVSNNGYAYINEPDIMDTYTLITEVDTPQIQAALNPMLEKLCQYMKTNIDSTAYKLGLYNHTGWKIDNILLLGGASQTIGVLEFITQYFYPTTVISCEEKTLNVVKGLAIWSSINSNPIELKTVYPFNFYIQKYDKANNTYTLESINFDTSNLELDLSGIYKICSIPVKSDYNLSTDNTKAKFKIYEIEEGVENVSIERFLGQEIVLSLELPTYDNIENIDIELNFKKCELTTNISYLYPESHQLDIQNTDMLKDNKTWLAILHEVNLFNNELNNDLKQFLNTSYLTDSNYLKDELELIRFKLLTLLHLIS